MAANLKPTIFIIGGAFHTPESYQTLITALETSGYEVHVPHLPSCNQSRPPNADLSSDTAHIRSYIESLVRDGRKVVVIAHSYGGQICSNALCGLGAQVRSSQGLKGGITALIYMSSWALPEGSTALDKAEEFGNMDLIPIAFDIAEDQTGVVRDPKTAFVGPGVDDAAAEAYLSTLIRWNTQCFYQRIEHAAWREIQPIVYIYTTADMMVPLHYQRSVVEGVEKEGVKVQTFELNAGHCPYLTDAQRVVDIVNETVAG
ncbi:hypothetical protein VPNG_01991 [Cytospora leucostoma]|uniref:AB hydrolase-1 domain-containing protein n=1 Tax=Cytospora leucostoma TaxID=1230097 RepID=A0A423XIL9_9PEZI|nr:hypothetical protein VPNG_01991 [Cytospora leucostoma]